MIQRSETEFLAVARSDFTAVCRRPGPEQWARFERVYRRRRRARIALRADITAGGVRVGRHTGDYVALAAN